MDLMKARSEYEKNLDEASSEEEKKRKNVEADFIRSCQIQNKSLDPVRFLCPDRFLFQQHLFYSSAIKVPIVS